MHIDRVTALALALRAAPGAYAALIGSGMSSAAGIPTGWDIALDLIRRVAAAESEDPGQDPERGYIDRYGEAPRYPTLLDALAKTQAERQALVRRYIEPTEDDRTKGLKLPTKAHHQLADLVARGYMKVIITTNFTSSAIPQIVVLAILQTTGRLSGNQVVARHAWSSHSGRHELQNIVRHRRVGVRQCPGRTKRPPSAASSRWSQRLP